MANYRLSLTGAKDFDQIFDYGIDTYGLDAATFYQNNMKICFEEIAEAPHLNQAVDDIRRGYRRAVFKSHSIYYRIDASEVVIVRILGQQDPFAAFE